jgi:hypothetical protein
MQFLVIYWHFISKNTVRINDLLTLKYLCLRGLVQGGPPGGQELDSVLGQELGVAVEERLVVRLVLELLVAVALGLLVVLVELKELAGLLEVALLVMEELAVSQVLLVKTNFIGIPGCSLSLL